MRTSCLSGCTCTYGHLGTWGWGSQSAPAKKGLHRGAVILSAGSGPGRQEGALFCPKVLQGPLGRNPLPTSQPGWGRDPTTQSRWGVPGPRPGWRGAVFPQKACGRCSHPSSELHVTPHTSMAVRLSGCPAVWAFLSRRRAGGRTHPKGTEPLSCHTHTPNGLSTSRPPFPCSLPETSAPGLVAAGLEFSQPMGSGRGNLGHWPQVCVGGLWPLPPPTLWSPRFLFLKTIPSLAQRGWLSFQSPPAPSLVPKAPTIFQWKHCWVEMGCG